MLFIFLQKAFQFFLLLYFFLAHIFYTIFSVYYIMNKEFDKLCTPAKLYFLIAVISILYALFNHFNIVFSIIKLIFALVWTLVLSCLCDKGFTYLSWFLVLFPYFLMLIAFLGIYRNREGMTDAILEGTATKKNPVLSGSNKQGFTVGGGSTGIIYPNK